MKRKIYACMLVLVMISVSLVLVTSVSAKDLIVISNRSVPVTELSKRDIKSIYLGQKKMWPNGVKIVSTKLAKGEQSKKFLKQYVRKNQSMFDKYWKKKVFTGGGKPPATFAKEKDLVKYVEATKGAIGFVSSMTYTDRVKILAVSH